MSAGFPALLRRWRAARRLTQEQLAEAAEISTRHLSCLERGRARPSRTSALVLANALDLDLRERNELLLAAGFAPAYPAEGLDSLTMAPVRRAIDLLLARQEPFPAVLLDRCWDVLEVNQGAARLFGAFMPGDMPASAAGNLHRATLHPLGLRRFIVNWPEVAALSVSRLQREVDTHPEDAARRALWEELRGWPGVAEAARDPRPGPPVVAVHLRRPGLELRLFTMLTTLGTPLDVTAAELTLETFLPLDAATEAWFEER